MNAERILKLADIIEKTPHVPLDRGYPDAAPLTGFNMCDWHCGTAGCIAGWAVQTFGDQPHIVSYMTYGAKLLDLSIDDADDLFGPPIMMSYDDIKPSQAAAVLRHLAATGNVDWSVQS